MTGEGQGDRYETVWSKSGNLEIWQLVLFSPYTVTVVLVCNMSVRLYRECKLGHLEDDVKPLAPAQFPDDEDDNDDDSVVYYVDDDDRSDEDEDEQMRQRGDYDELTPQEQALEDFRRHILASSGNCCGYEESYWAMKKMHPQ